MNARRVALHVVQTTPAPPRRDWRVLALYGMAGFGCASLGGMVGLGVYFLIAELTR